LSSIKITRENLMNGSIRALQNSQAEAFKELGHRSETQMAELLDQTLAGHDMAEDLWVFGYGSLIWNPAFHYVEKRPVLLQGWHRRFCLKMYLGRGTPETPGIMLALDRGGACKGVAFRIAADKIREELNLLWQREMYGGAYLARWVNLCDGKERLRGVTFVINREHPRYLKELSVEQTAALISTGCGALGTCQEYLENTVQHLKELGLRDTGLSRIVAALPKR
jgi:cation transport protein ChaC